MDYGNTGRGVLKGGIHNQKDSWLTISLWSNDIIDLLGLE